MCVLARDVPSHFMDLPTGEVSLLYNVYFARYGPKPRT